MLFARRVCFVTGCCMRSTREPITYTLWFRLERRNPNVRSMHLKQTPLDKCERTGIGESHIVHGRTKVASGTCGTNAALCSRWTMWSMVKEAICRTLIEWYLREHQKPTRYRRWY